MSLNEETCLCLMIGIISFILAFKNLTMRRFTPIVQPPPPEITAKKTSEEASAATPPLSIEEQRARIEAHLEALHREQWCKEFEDMEVHQRLAEKMYQYEDNRQAAVKLELEQAQNRLRDLQFRRRCLEQSLMTDGRLDRYGGLY